MAFRTAMTACNPAAQLSKGAWQHARRVCGAQTAGIGWGKTKYGAVSTCGRAFSSQQHAAPAPTSTVTAAEQGVNDVDAAENDDEEEMDGAGRVYPEQKQRRDIKAPEFYETQADLKRYFYYVDVRGWLFLEQTVPKMITTSLKAPKFLDFFFRQLTLNTPTICKENDVYCAYPYISPCGPELNFVKAADSPIVFHTLKPATGDTPPLLVYAHSLTVPFDPAALTITARGRMHHPASGTKVGGRGLLAPTLVHELQASLHVQADGTLALLWDGKEYQIPLTPISAPAADTPDKPRQTAAK